MKNEEVMDAATRANRRKRQKGVTIVEYAIMLALIAIAVVETVFFHPLILVKVCDVL